MNWLTACLVAVLFALVPQQVFAHVLITDDTKSKGAILHIIPDDDPVAGEKAVLYFDTQGGLLTDKATVELQVTNSAGDVAKVPTKIDTSLVTAEYIFPVQGAYELKYTVSIPGKTYEFTQTQRVSRGVVGSALDRPSYALAEIGILASGIGIVLLAIVAFNRRRSIAAYSSF